MIAPLITPTVPPIDTLSSPAMTTPRPLSAVLLPLRKSSPVGASAPTNGVDNVGDGQIGDPEDSHASHNADTTAHALLEKDLGHHSLPDTPGFDGRQTPLASGSSRHSPSVTSNLISAHPSSPRTSSAVEPPPTQPAFNILPVPQAEFGLSNLATEKQLRESATGKDRMFLLLLSRELEAFIARIFEGDVPDTYVPPAAPPGSLLGQLYPAIPLTTTTTSKYQRMLVYKAAEWYGLKGVAAPDGGIYIGVLGSLDDRSIHLRLSSLAPKPPSPKQNFKIMQRVPLGSNSGASSRPASTVDDGSEAGTSKRKTLEEREAEYALAKERIYGSSTSSVAPSEPGLEDDEPRGRTARNDDLEDDEVDPVPRHPYGSNGMPVYASLYHPGPEGPSHAPIPQQQYQSPDSMFAFQPNMPQPGYALGGYPAYPDGYMNGSPFIQPNGFGPQWQQPMLNAQGSMAPGWGYNGMPVGIPNQPMPMIPQGMPAYPQGYGYPYQQQPQGYGATAPLVQPTPMRPGPYPHGHPHSSNSSSISSRSYQDYSRPHSRGSTTSTRSAASSVRLGVMYPAGQPGHGPGYRQKGIKGQSLNGLTSLGVGERRSTRGHSPSSATTTSSRSSRRTTSITVQQPLPGQHQLPQRPDWAANNVPYHPSPMMQIGVPAPAGPNVSDFPPLLRHGTNAEPMQVERAKMRPANGTVWNGSAGQAIQTSPPAQPPTVSLADSPVATSPLPRANEPATPLVPVDADPDFPRRTATRGAPSLYDPSAPKPSSRPASALGELSAEEAIEAKLAALSVTSGISIGPAPAKAPSYAKIVRRD